jgi:hypothetical protein
MESTILIMGINISKQSYLKLNIRYESSLVRKMRRGRGSGRKRKRGGGDETKEGKTRGKIKQEITDTSMPKYCVIQSTVTRA